MSQNLRVLITCGPTWTPVDSVRVLSNTSTGELGHDIADAFVKKNAKVTMIEGAVTHQFDNRKVRIIPFRFYRDIARLLKKELQKKYDIVIHAAAVSDFEVKSPYSKKIDSSAKKISLELKPTQKLINDIKKTASQPFLVGFKLDRIPNTSSAIKKSQKLFTEARCDLVVANTADQTAYSGFVLNVQGDILAKAKSRKQLAKNLVTIVHKELESS